MSQKLCVVAILVAMGLMATASYGIGWSENFESYADNSSITDQAGWTFNIYQPTYQKSQYARVDDRYMRATAHMGNKSLRVSELSKGYVGSSNVEAIKTFTPMSDVRYATFSVDYLNYWQMDNSSWMSGKGMFIDILTGTGASIGQLYMTDGSRGYRFNGLDMRGTAPYPLLSDNATNTLRWNHMTFNMDFATQQITYVLNGVTVATMPFSTSATIGDFSKVGFATDFYYPGSSTEMSNWFDNINVTPEPATIGLLLMGALGLIRRKR